MNASPFQTILKVSNIVSSNTRPDRIIVQCSHSFSLQPLATFSQKRLGSLPTM